jgi:hypothetical protein
MVNIFIKQLLEKINNKNNLMIKSIIIINLIFI